MVRFLAVFACCALACSSNDANGGDGGLDAGLDAPSDVAADVSATPDADASPPDASGPTLCGSVQCRDGQSCVANACVYTSCTGSNVPGDYATVQAAVTALSSVGGTICLGAQSFPERVLFANTKPLVLQGVSALQSIVTDMEIQTNATADITLRGIGLDATGYGLSIVSTGAKTTIDDCIIHTANDPGLLIGADQTVTVRATVIDVTSAAGGVNVSLGEQGPTTLLFDGVDIRAENPIAPAFTVQDQSSPSTPVSITIQNTYLHDSNVGVSYESVAGHALETVLTLDNDTFARNGTALEVTANDPGVVLSFHNDIFWASQLAVSVMGLTPDDGNNCLFGNQTNYAGTAVDGPSYLKADPMLDTAVTPPSLKVGSPARGAGDLTHAPASDYWGNARAGHADIGAIQAL